MATNDVTRLVPNQKVNVYSGIIVQVIGGAACIRKHSPDGQQEMSRKNLVGDLPRSYTREIIAYVYLRGKLNNVTLPGLANRQSRRNVSSGTAPVRTDL